MKYATKAFRSPTALVLLAGLALRASLPLFSHAQTETVSSPDGTISVVFELADSVPTYAVSRAGVAIIERSRLGVVLRNAAPLTSGFSVAGVARSEHNDVWEQVWGETAQIRDHHREMRITLEETGVQNPRTMVLRFRVFDDGVGFRYEWPSQPYLDEFVVEEEVTEFSFAQDNTSWWIPAFEHQRYEYLYARDPVSRLGRVHTPLTMVTPDGLYLSLHEAALTDYASMALQHTGGTTLRAELVPWSDGAAVFAEAPHVSPWRTIQIADEPGELIASYLVLNLNEPNKLDDTSWIQPGKYVGVWWEMHLGISSWGSGETHGATTENVKRYIDFAAAHGFDGVLVEGWNTGWDGDWAGDGEDFSFTEAHPDFDMEYLSRYAGERGVYIIGHHENGGGVENYARQLEGALDYYAQRGVRAVKSGYVEWGQDIKRTLPANTVPTSQQRRVGEWHHGQFMVEHYRHVLQRMADHKIMLNVHEPIKPTGIRRTYPNMMTREGARGQEYNSTWGGGNGLDHNVTLPFTRLLAGPMDFTPGTFDLDGEGPGPQNAVESTLAHQLALYVVMYSPLQMASDLPENYESHPEAFQFIKDVPVDWSDTRVVHARIGDFVTIARKDRNSEDWYLGGITDGQPRTLVASLDFLDAGRTYTAEIYADAVDANWETNPEAYTIARQTVDASTALPMKLAPGGGIAVRFVATANEAEE